MLFSLSCRAREAGAGDPQRPMFAAAPGSPIEILLADVNHDGRLDALAAAGEGVRVMLGDGRGNFRPASGSPVVAGRGVWRFAVSDLNGDGKLDLVTANLESGSVSVLLGQ